MDFIKHFFNLITAFIILLLLSAYDHLFGHVFSEWVLSHFGPIGKTIIADALVEIGLIILAFQIGVQWHTYFTPIQRFKIFINRAIRYGKKLNSGKLDDVMTKRLADGSMDQDEVRGFRKAFTEWHFCIHKCFLNAFKESKSTIFSTDEAAFAFPGSFVYGGMRNDLLIAIKQLEEIKRDVKSDWFVPGFVAENLKEYETFKL